MTVVWNAVLVRFAGGHTYVDRSNGHGRRELYLEMGGVVDEQNARELGAQFLALSRDEIHTLAQQGLVRSIDQVPGLAIDLADTIAGDPVVSIASTLVGDGDVQVTVEMGDARKVRLEALARQLARAGSGQRSEYSAPKVDGQAQGSGNESSPPEWSQSGEAVVSFSAPWHPGRPFQMTHLELSCSVEGGPTQVRVVRDRHTVAVCTLPAGRRRALPIVDRLFPTGSELVLVCQLAGVGVQGLSAIPRGAFV